MALISADCTSGLEALFQGGSLQRLEFGIATDVLLLDEDVGDSLLTPELCVLESFLEKGSLFCDSQSTLVSGLFN